MAMPPIHCMIIDYHVTNKVMSVMINYYVILFNNLSLSLTYLKPTITATAHIGTIISNTVPTGRLNYKRE